MGKGSVRAGPVIHTSSTLDSHLESSRSCFIFLRNMSRRRSLRASDLCASDGMALMGRLEKGVLDGVPDEELEASSGCCGCGLIKDEHERG